MEIPIKEINERLERSENTPIESEENWYRTNRFFDWLFDTVPYGWRLYYRWGEVRRWCINMYQRIRYGVSDAECWDLDSTISKFILPRLKHFKKMNRNFYNSELTSEEWENVIDELIWTFEYLIDDDRVHPFPIKLIDDRYLDINREKTPEEKIILDKWRKKSSELDERKQKGLQLFAKYYCHLWD